MIWPEILLGVINWPSAPFMIGIGGCLLIFHTRSNGTTLHTPGGWSCGRCHPAGLPYTRQTFIEITALHGRMNSLWLQEASPPFRLLGGAPYLDLLSRVGLEFQDTGSLVIHMYTYSHTDQFTSGKGLVEKKLFNRQGETSWDLELSQWYEWNKNGNKALRKIWNSMKRPPGPRISAQELKGSQFIIPCHVTYK